MPILFHAPLACSLAVRFAAAEGDVPLDIEYVNLGSKETESGGTLLDTNPLGQVSTLRLDSGELLTENTAILMWVQSQSHNRSFRREPSDNDYYQLLRWIAFCSTELHKQLLRVLFYPEATDEVKERFRGLAPKKFEVLNTQLTGSQYLLGDHFTAADAYLAWFFTHAERANLDPWQFPALVAYQERTLARPKIRELLEGDRIKRSEMDAN